MQEVVSDKERAEILKAIMSIPVGAGKRFLVSVSGQPCAGFDTREGAATYVAMMKRDANRPKAPSCAKMDWSVQDRG